MCACLACDCVQHVQACGGPTSALRPNQLAAPLTPGPRPPLQCRDVRPLEELPDGTPVRFNNYQLWWQTILAKIAPHLRGQGWSNFK